MYVRGQLWAQNKDKIMKQSEVKKGCYNICHGWYLEFIFQIQIHWFDQIKHIGIDADVQWRNVKYYIYDTETLLPL